MSSETTSQPASPAARRPHRRRHERNPNVRVVITDRDRAVFKLLTVLRVATAELLFPLVAGTFPDGFESPRVLWRRLLALYDTYHLVRPPGQYLRSQDEKLPHGRQPDLYALGNKGAAELRAHGVELPQTDYEVKANELKGPSFAHLVATSDAVAAFLLAFRARRDIDLLDVLPDGKFSSYVMVSGKRFPVNPDATFLVREPAKEPTAFFLEVDRDTMPVLRTAHEQSSFLKKVTGYLAYRSEKRRLKEELGVEDFVVLTVTNTPTHATVLRTDTASANAKRPPTDLDLFWFTTSADLRNHGLAGPLIEAIWTTPDGETGILL